MSINVVKLEIPNLDFWLYGVKRSWLPAGTRFGNITTKNALQKVQEQSSSWAFLVIEELEIPILDFCLSGVKRNRLPRGTRFGNITTKNVLQKVREQSSSWAFLAQLQRAKPVACGCQGFRLLWGAVQAKERSWTST